MIAASKLTSSLSEKIHHLNCTQYRFRDLKWRSWAVSLLTHGAQPPPSNCREIDFEYSEFDRFCDLSTCQNLPVLYPSKVITTLAQKLFRREPAITRFDQLITPYLKSSERIAQLYRSVLHLSFDKLQPAQGKLIWLRVSCILHTRYSHSVSLRLQPLGLSPQYARTRWLILQQARCHRLATTTTPCKHMVSGLFQRPYRAAFHLSLTVLVHYRSLRIFSLAGQFRQIPPSHSCLEVLKNGNKKDYLISTTGLSPSGAKLSSLFFY